MKTKLVPIIAGLALLVSTNTFAAVTKEGSATTLKEPGNISQIEASGNVEVYITNGNEDGVEIYNDYHGDNTMVQNTDGVLRIASYKPEALIVIVTVSDLRAITANDNAIIKSYKGDLSAKSLDITLNDDAIVSLQVLATAANINVNDKAHADLIGMIDFYHINYSKTASVDKRGLQTYSSTERQIEQLTRLRRS